MKTIKKIVTIVIELENDTWRDNEDLEDVIESSIVDNINDLIEINVSVKNFVRGKNKTKRL